MVERNAAYVDLRRAAVAVGRRYAAGRRIVETGHVNRGPVVDRFLTMAGMSLTEGDDEASVRDRQWCGAFVYSCYLEAALGPQAQSADDAAILRAARGRVPFAATDVISGQRVRRYVRAHPEHAVRSDGLAGEPQFGDIFAVANFHVAMVVAYDARNGSVRTVEGNQSDPGDRWSGVCEKSRDVADLRWCFGF